MVHSASERFGGPCIDGLSGFAEAIHTVYEKTKVQLCVVHLVRAALRYVSDQDVKAVVRDLKKIYNAAKLVEAEAALQEFAAAWALKIMSMAILEASRKWTMPIRNWIAALNYFAILYEDRLPDEYRK
jgi:transposase-like protein